MPRFNLESPNHLSQKCNLADLTAWALKEASAVSDSAVRECVTTVCKSLDVFVRWPGKAVLLWGGCDRIAPPGERQRIHTFPEAKASYGVGVALGVEVLVGLAVAVGVKVCVGVEVGVNVGVDVAVAVGVDVAVAVAVGLGNATGYRAMVN